MTVDASGEDSFIPVLQACFYWIIERWVKFNELAEKTFEAAKRAESEEEADIAFQMVLQSVNIN